jgi:hypothetical protein
MPQRFPKIASVMNIAQMRAFAHRTDQVCDGTTLAPALATLIEDR